MEKMFKLSAKSKIYVICPANNKTGGTELLHQLVFQLNKQGKNAYITYYLEGKCNKDIPTPDEFKKYVSDYLQVEDIEDSPENVIILPEVCIGKHRKYKRIQKSVWWLSVDNYTAMLGKIQRLKKYGILSLMKHLYLNDFICPSDIRAIKVHLYQSYFASDFLKKKGINSNCMVYLSDYVNDIYFDGFNVCGRENVVIYNPKKGVEFTQQLIQAAPDIKFIPIINMTNIEVRSLMHRAKVYIDFGNHPGKDRIPREAAMCGCCIVTNRKGSAGFHQDVPIADKYKFDDKADNVPQIISVIKECLYSYENHIDKFKGYRNFISGEKIKFLQDVGTIF